MQKLIITGLASIAVLGLLMNAQSGSGKTQVNPGQIVMPAAANPLVIGSAPGAAAASAQVIQLGAGFALNTATSPYTLTVVSPAAPTEVIGETYYPTATQAVFTLEDSSTLVAGTVKAYRNGMRMAIPGDYSVSAAGVVTFVNINIPEAGDTIVFDYKHN